MRRGLYVRKIFTIISWQDWPSASIFGCSQEGRGFKPHKERKEMEKEEGSFEAGVGVGVGVAVGVGVSHGIYGVGS